MKNQYIYENYRPSIIPKSFFDYAQEKRENHNVKYHPVTFNQLIFCGCCTRNTNSVTRNRKYKRDSYYSCNVFRRKHNFSDDYFRKVIRKIVKDTNDENFIESLVTRIYGQIVEYKLACVISKYA